jgi:hypothetical protein
MSNENPFDGMPIIYSYSRARAIEDGVLVDLTEWAKPVGFVIPVACTAVVWHQCIQPQESSKALGECERVRAHVLLWTLYRQISAHSGAVDQLMFELSYHNTAGNREAIKLKAICGPGDQGEPVLTVLLPNED